MSARTNPDSTQDRTMRSLTAAMVLQFALGGAVVPFIGIILRDRGLNYTQVSWILMASAATLLVVPFVWGFLADRFLPLNRMFTLLNGLALFALAGLIHQEGFWGLLLCYLLFYACFQPTMTLINALSFHHLPDPKRQFGRLRAWGSMGWILPSVPMYFWMARGRDSQLDIALFLGLGIALLLILATYWLPHTEPGAGKNAPTSNSGIPYWRAVRLLLSNANYLTVLISFFLMSGSFNLTIYFAPPFLEGLGLSRAWIGPIQSFGIAVEILLFPWLRRLLNRWGYLPLIITGCGMLAARHLMFAFSSQVGWLSASYSLAGGVVVFYIIPCSMLANTLARIEVRATAQTLLTLVGSGMGPVFANWIAGLITRVSGDNLRPVFLACAGLSMTAGLLLLARRKQLLQESGMQATGDRETIA